MSLRERLKEQPMVVVQGDVTGTLWLEHDGGMKIKVFGEFDKKKFVHAVGSFGDVVFAVKINGKNAVDFLPEKEYGVDWAIEEKGVALPEGYVDEDFIEGVRIEYPATVIAGVVDDNAVSFGDGIAGSVRIVSHETVEVGWKSTTTRWLSIEVHKELGGALCCGDEVSRAVDGISLGLSLAFWRPVVKKTISVQWKDGDEILNREIEFGRKSIFKYSEKFDGGFSTVIMNKGGLPVKLLDGILGKNLGPLKLWRSFTLSYSDKTGFLEDRFKNLFAAIDSVYELCFEDGDTKREREMQYKDMVERINACETAIVVSVIKN